MLLVIIISPVINASTYKEINNDRLAYKTNKVIITDSNGEVFCEILLRMGIFLEELYKFFPEGTIIYPILVLMMLPVILLWNKYCDEFSISYDLSLTGNFHITPKISGI